MNDILVGDVFDVLPTLPAEHFHCVVTSVPYWQLRSYMPDAVRLRPGTPPEVLEELELLGIAPIDHE